MCVCVFANPKARGGASCYGGGPGAYGKFLPAVKCSVAVWIHTEQILAVAQHLVSAPIKISREDSQSLLVGEQFNSESSKLQFPMEKVGSNAADNLQLPLIYGLVYTHPYHLKECL